MNSSIFKKETSNIGLQIAYSPIYKYQLPEKHRFPMIKYELIPEQLIYEGTISESQLFHPQKLSEETLLLTHDLAYWEKLKKLHCKFHAANQIFYEIKSFRKILLISLELKERYNYIN